LAKKTVSKPDPEMKLARYLASAFIAYSHGIGMDRARKNAKRDKNVFARRAA